MKRMPSRSFGFFILGAFFLVVPAIIAFYGYTGAIIVARENNTAPFDKTLILIDHHNLDGGVGIILNKPLSDDQKAELPPFLRDAGIPVGYGGPVGFPERIIVLEERLKKSAPPKIWFDLNDWDEVVAKTPDLLDRIRQDTKQGGQHYRIFAGLAAWAPFQLETEMAINNVWFAIKPTHDRVFQNGADTSWDVIHQQEEARKKSATENKT